MKGARGWIIAAVVAILIAGAAYLVQPQKDSPEHSSNSDAANGASAALLFAQAMGHPADQITGSFTAQPPYSMMFVFTPTSPFTADDAASTRDWVRFGGVLVYASEQGDPELDRALGVSRFGGYVPGGDYKATPAVAGVGTVVGSNSDVIPLDPSPNQVTFLRTAQGFAVGYIETLGQGTVIVLADPLVLCNGYLEKADNGRLLADLIGTVDPNSHVAFDEFHHGLTTSDFAPQAWITTPWGAGLLWLLVAVFVGLVLRGRRFGPLLERPAEVARSDAEWSVAVGQLLRRSSGRGVALGLLAGATERAVAARTGLPLQPRERFWNALWVRAPEVAAELAQIETSLYAASGNERELLNAARRLHEIAHPAPRATLK
ncbi:MAG: hypothetical protein AUI15_11905 [Actinobacteria bacterium 13_2_20CM_2_66_6]|nr:MAG: hypothetical protein AUI15_11905 [Actinobacteria bacterium 13_2_20CM_2_66_6]